MQLKRFVFLSLVISITGLAGADEVYFKNGDKLSGKIINVLEGTMTFESTVAGTIPIDMSQVKTFSSEVPITVILDDETRFSQKVLDSGEGKFSIAGDQNLKSQDFMVENIKSINPPPPAKPRWKGSISAGLTSSHGNTKNSMRSVALDMKKRGEKDRTTLSAYYIKGKQTDTDTGEETITEDNWNMRAKYDYFFTKKIYGYLDGRYEKDSVANLDRRMILGLGGGYQWVETEDFNFSLEAGLASLYEKFDNNPNGNTELSAQLGYALDKKVYENIMFLHGLTYYPSTEKVSDYYLTSTAEVRAGVTETVFTNFKVIFDYDTTPAAGSGSTDVKYILGAGLNF